MKTIVTLSLLMGLLVSQAMGFGLLTEGEGNLALDNEAFKTPYVYDYNQDGRTDLVVLIDHTLMVKDLTGATLWSTTIDVNSICPTCIAPDGWWNFEFFGFFNLEAGHFDIIIRYTHYAGFSGDTTRGIAVIATENGAVRFNFSDAYYVGAIDLDGDNLSEILLDFGDSDNETYQVWGANGSGQTNVPEAVGKNLRLGNNYPNPFNPKTTVMFELADASSTLVAVHDAAGRMVFQRPLGFLPAGPHQFSWTGVNSQGAKMASGTYILTVTTENQREVRKMMLLK